MPDQSYLVSLSPKAGSYGKSQFTAFSDWLKCKKRDTEAQGETLCTALSSEELEAARKVFPDLLIEPLRPEDANAAVWPKERLKL